MAAVLSIFGAGRLVDVQGISKDEANFRSSNLVVGVGKHLPAAVWRMELGGGRVTRGGYP